MREYSVSGCKIINIFLYGQIFLAIFSRDYFLDAGVYFDRSIFFGRGSPQIEPADLAQIFLSFVALFDADRDLGLLRGGRIGAD